MSSRLWFSSAVPVDLLARTAAPSWWQVHPRSLCSQRLPQARRDVSDPARSFDPFPELAGARRSAAVAWLRRVRSARDWSSYCSVYLASLLSSWPSWSQRFVLDLSYPWHAALTLRTSPEFRRKSPVILVRSSSERSRGTRGKSLPECHNSRGRAL